MICIEQARNYCREDISKIENYQEAMDDTTQTWCLHHRLESDYTMDELKALGCYYGRTACELIFLTKSQHMSTYHKGKSCKETRQKLSEANRGKKRSEESIRKAANSHRGFRHSEESKRKIGKANRGKKRSEETCRKISEIRTGRKLKPHSEESRMKASMNNRGKHNHSGSNNPNFGKKHPNGHYTSTKGMHRVYHEDGTYHMENS